MYFDIKAYHGFSLLLPYKKQRPSNKAYSSQTHDKES